MRACVILCIGLIPSMCGAQNLVPNGSFEDTLCVGTINSVPIGFHATHWYNPNGGTSDLYGAQPTAQDCFATYLYDPDFLQQGNWQYPYEGERMAGLLCHMAPACGREYLQAALIEPLEKGAKYCVSLKVSLAEYSGLAIDRLGVHLSTDPVLDYSNACAFDDLVAQVESMAGEFLVDTIDWMVLEGDFIALGGELYITIGNITPIMEMNAITVEGTSGLPSAYYFFDDIVLERCDIQTGVNDAGTLHHVRYDSASGTWTAMIEGPGSLEFFDPSGRLMRSFEVGHGPFTLYLPHLSPGLYLWRMRNSNGTLSSARVLVP